MEDKIGKRHDALGLSVWILPLLLFAVAIALALGHFAVRGIEDDWVGAVPGHIARFFRMLDLNEEASIPTWYSVLLWIFASGLSLLVGVAESGSGRSSWRWAVLAAVFLLLSLDEGAALHEAIGDVLGLYLPSGPFTWSWIYYGLAFLIVVGVIMLPLLLRLPRLALLSFMLAGLVYLLGTLGFEMYGAAIFKKTIDFAPGLDWPRIIVAEELLEMTGQIIAIATLLGLLRRAGEVKIGAH